ncbi:hypothetical protein STIUS_v1c03710 [Spiroplasma sp. TIUS-1]|uniref:SprT-like domain-containing protein n=1 Tax=Spiroplasma sp. TIUS-1 TaxID=216963 RepID=UPI001397636D|nr:SprT-like domain-containing protein [Spiroplasma sp. TIUS-1]QHX35925.1 hypothetical protein STIUS_v1c03710 [Spiroplasma sp. TIUS-1]
MNINIDEIITELTSVHYQLNKILFKSSLKQLKIGVETSKHRRINAYAYFEPYGGWLDGGSQITILTKRLDGNYINIISTLVHEMSHQYNFENNIKDTEPSNGRHNKNFKITAKNLGLLNVENNISKNGGGCSTSPSDELIFIIKNKLDFNKAALKIIHEDSITIEKVKQKNYKYVCECGKIIRSKSKLNINCNECNTVFSLKNV